MKTIPLTSSDKVALVDDIDFAAVNQFRWRLSRGYPVRSLSTAGAGSNCKKFNQYLHYFLKGSREGFEIDHKDGNVLNCQGANLRWATSSQQKANTKKRIGCVSKVKGVFWHLKNHNWVARITHKGKTTSLGSFATEEAAGHAYDRAAFELFGEFARPNFPV